MDNKQLSRRKEGHKFSVPQAFRRVKERVKEGVKKSAAHLFLRKLVMCSVLIAGPSIALSTHAQSLDELNGLTSEASSSYFSRPASAISLKQATAIVRKQVGGRVLSASPHQAGQTMQYRVRVLVDGERVITVTVDQDGRVIRRR